MQKICLIEDSKDYQIIISEELLSWFEVTCANNLNEARTLLNTQKFDLILLDVNLPDGNGFDFCIEIRNSSSIKDIPIIFLTGKNEPNDVVMGFSMGGDDFIGKPFEPMELRARIQARMKKSKASINQEDCVVFGDIKFDRIKQRVFISNSGNETNLKLTPFEFKILLFLATKHGEFFNRSDLLKKLNDPNVHVKDENIYTHISSLRRKLGPRADYLECIPRVGYRFNAPSLKP